MSADGSTIVIGYGQDSRWKVFELVDFSWQEDFEIYLSPDATSGYAGEAGISNDGTILAVSSPRDGNVQVYRLE